MHRFSDQRVQYITGVVAVFLLFAIGVRLAGHQAGLTAPVRQTARKPTPAPKRIAKSTAISTGSATLAYINYTPTAGASAGTTLLTPTPTPASQPIVSVEPTTAPTQTPSPTAQPSATPSPASNPTSTPAQEDHGNPQNQDNNGHQNLVSEVANVVPAALNLLNK